MYWECLNPRQDNRQTEWENVLFDLKNNLIQYDDEWIQKY